MNFFYVYIIKSMIYNQLYIGFTTREVTQRVKDHNQSKVKSTRDYTPWKIVYFEAYKSEKDARHRERMLKQYGNSLGHLKKRITNSIFQK